MKFNPGVPEINRICTFDGLDDVLKGSGNNTSLILFCPAPLHCVGLPRSGLSIGEYCTIVAFQDTLYNWQGCLFENALLGTCWREYQVEAEVPLFLSYLFGTCNDNLSPVWNDIDNRLIILGYFTTEHWSASDGDFYTLVLIRHFKFSREFKCYNKRSQIIEYNIKLIWICYLEKLLFSYVI